MNDRALKLREDNTIEESRGVIAKAFMQRNKFIAKAK